MHKRRAFIYTRTPPRSRPAKPRSPRLFFSPLYSVLHYLHHFPLYPLLYLLIRSPLTLFSNPLTTASLFFQFLSFPSYLYSQTFYLLSLLFPYACLPPLFLPPTVTPLHSLPSLSILCSLSSALSAPLYPFNPLSTSLFTLTTLLSIAPIPPAFFLAHFSPASTPSALQHTHCSRALCSPLYPPKTARPGFQFFPFPTIFHDLAGPLRFPPLTPVLFFLTS